MVSREFKWYIEDFDVKFTCLANCLAIEEIEWNQREFVQGLFEKLDTKGIDSDAELINKTIIRDFENRLNNIWNPKHARIEVKRIDNENKIPHYKLSFRVEVAKSA